MISVHLAMGLWFFFGFGIGAVVYKYFCDRSPELLKSLTQISQISDHWSWYSESRFANVVILGIAREAIAKATGKQYPPLLYQQMQIFTKAMREHFAKTRT